MLNINRLINRIRDPREPRDTPPASPARTPILTDGENEIAEGFLCPTCHQGFPSPEELQTHYEAYHSENSVGGHVCPACRMKLKTKQEFQDHFATYHVTANNGDLQTLKQEVTELQTNLREEKWYSEDLKREVERLQTSVDTKASGDKNEVEYVYKSQIKSLEENKALLASEVVLLRKQLAEAVDNTTAVKHEKDKVEQKAALLSGDVAELKAEVNEISGYKEALEDQQKLLKEHVQDLQAQLQQRPAADDVAVLRQELVQVQTLMDRMTREREAEKETLEQEYRRLLGECERLKTEKRDVEQQLEEAPRRAELESLQAVIAESSSGSKELQLSLQKKMQENIEMESKLSKVGKEVSRLTEELTSKAALCDDAQQQVVNREDELRYLQRQLKEHNVDSKQTEAHLQENVEKLKNAEAELSSVQTSMKYLSDDFQQQLLEKEQSMNALRLQFQQAANNATEKDSSIESIGRQMDSLQAQYHQTATENDALRADLRERETQIDEIQRQKEIGTQQLRELEATVAQFKETTERLEAERAELYGKIEAGEGANTAIQQLKQETASLQDKLSEQQKQAEMQTETANKKLDVFHQQLKEAKNQLQSADAKCGKLEATLKELDAKFGKSQDRVVQLKTDLKAKTELHQTSEVATVNLKADFDCRTKKWQASVDEKDKHLDKLKNNLEKMKEELTQRTNAFKEMEANANRERETGRNLKAQYEKLDNKLKQQVELAEKLVRGKDEAEARSQETEQKLNATERNTLQLEQQHQTQAKALNETKTKLEAHVARLEGDVLKLTNEKNGLEKELHDAQQGAQREIAKLSDNLQQLQVHKKAAEADFQKTKAQRESEIQKLGLELSQLSGKAEAAESAANERGREMDALAKKMKEIHRTNGSLEQELAACKNRLNLHEEELKTKASEAAELTNNITAKETLLQKVQQELEECTCKLYLAEELHQSKDEDLKQLLEKHEEILEKLAGADKQLDASRSERDGMKTQLEELTRDLEESSQNEAALTKSLEDLNNVKSMLGKQVLTLDTDLKKTTEELNQQTLLKTALETEIFGKQAALSTLEENVSDLKKTVKDLQRNATDEQKANEAQMNDLQATKEVLTQQRAELQTQLSDALKRLAAEKDLHKRDKERLENETTDLARAKETSETRLESVEKSLDAVRQETERKEARYEMQIVALDENLATLRADFITEQNKAQEMEKKVDELSGDKLELEAKLENALDERRALLERCLNSEGECEKLRESSAELRHKLDDALAAIHELGRENQTLQIESAKITSRKWVDDANVLNCSLCQKLFSVTIRKHHCRNCGQVFCNECSSRTAFVASAKNAVRVCDLCFADMKK